MGQPKSHLRTTQIDKTLCQELLKKERLVLKNSIFNENLFKSICKNIANRNETKVI